MFEKRRFIVFWIIYLVVILIKDIIMFLLGFNIWLTILTTLGFGIIYWIVIIKKILMKYE